MAIASSRRIILHSASYIAALTTGENREFTNLMARFEKGGIYDKQGIDINFQMDKPDAAHPENGRTGIEVLVGENKIAFEQYVGDGSDITRYQININIDYPTVEKGADDVQNLGLGINTTIHEFCGHAIDDYAESILAIKNGTMTFSDFHKRYVDAIASAKIDPVNYRSLGHDQIRSGTSAAYNSLTLDVINYLKENRATFPSTPITSYSNNGRGNGCPDAANGTNSRRFLFRDVITRFEQECQGLYYDCSESALKLNDK